MRGALKVEVSSPEAVVTAAGDFSLFVIVHNPFDVPVKLYSVETHLPAELVDSIWLTRRKLADRQDSAIRMGEAHGAGAAWLRVKLAFASITRRFSPPDSPRIAAAISAEQEANLAPAYLPSVNATISAREVGSGARIVGVGDIWDLSFPENPSAEDLDRIIMKIEDYRTGKVPVVLEPGNSVVRHFVLRARRWLFFSPIAYTFEIQIKYLVDDHENLDTASATLVIRAALKAVIIGAVIGGLLGSSARSLGSSNSSLSLGALVLSAILGSVAVVALARKNSAQQIVSVEDVWGGLLVGFLVGYLGEEYFRQFIK